MAYQNLNGKSNAILFNASEVERLGNNICDRILTNIQVDLQNYDINFTGELSKSFHRDWDGTFKTVQTSNIYAVFVENGMPPGKDVNFDALKNWVEKKLHITESTELTNVTWKIYRKIVNKGIAPKRFMKRAIQQFIGKHGKHTIRVKLTPQQKAWKKHSRNLNKLFAKINKAWKSQNKQNKQNNQNLKKKVNAVSKAYKTISRGIGKGRT